MKIPWIEVILIGMTILIVILKKVSQETDATDEECEGTTSTDTTQASPDVTRKKKLELPSRAELWTGILASIKAHSRKDILKLIGRFFLQLTMLCIALYFFFPKYFSMVVYSYGYRNIFQLLSISRLLRAPL